MAEYSIVGKSVPRNAPKQNQGKVILRGGKLRQWGAGKPVKVVFTREEVFIDGFNRLPQIIYLKDGVKSDYH